MAEITGGAAGGPAAGEGAGSSAPAPAAGTVTPAPAGTAGGQEAAGAPAEGQAQRDEAGRFIKAPKQAIKPIKFRLPGVFPDPGHEAARTQSPTKGAGQGVEAPGQAMEPPPTTAKGVTTAKGDVEGDVGSPDAPIPDKFEFGGEVWDDRAKAEQSFKTLRGQFKRFQQFEQNFKTANESAAAWKREAERRGQELEQLRSQAPGQVSREGQPSTAQGKSAAGDGPGAAPASEADVLDSIDWGLFSAISQQHGPEVAVYQVLKDLVPKLRESFQAEVKSVLEPYQQLHSQAARAQQAASLLEGVASYRYIGADGQPVLAYPELHDPEAAAVIGEIWSKLGFDDESRLTPKALHLAVLAYRDWKNVTGIVSAAAGQNPTPPSTDPAKSGAAEAAAGVVQALTGAQAGGDALSGAAPPLVRPATNPREAEAEQIKRETRKAGAPSAALGFGR